MELKRVVVTGLGAITPVGNNPEETWNNLLAGKSGAAPITLFDASQFKTQFACEVKGFNANDYIDRKEARKMDRYAQLALAAAVQAVDDCKMDLEAVDKDRIGVVFGVGIGGIKTFKDLRRDGGRGHERRRLPHNSFTPRGTGSNSRDEERTGGCRNEA